MKRTGKNGYAQIGLITLGVLMWPLLFITVPPSPLDMKTPHGVPGNETGEKRYTVTSVTDGDTIVAAHGEEELTVRLIGIDAPEFHGSAKPECFALEARLKAVQLLLGKEVRLSADPTQDDVDAYGRSLRYISLLGGENFNERMLKDGYAREYTHIVPYAFQEEFMKAADEAKQNERGLWGACR